MDTTPRHPAILPAAMAALCLAALWAPPAGGADDQAATRPEAEAGAPIPLPKPSTQPGKTIAQRITPTDQEKAVLSDLEDRTGRFDEAPLYATLAIAARAPKLDNIEWDDLDRPSYVNLVAEPERYRLRPLTMRVKVFYITKLQSGAGLNFSPLWPKDRVVWEMDCIQVDTPNQEQKPLRLYSVADPTPILGEPESRGPQNRGRYKNGREMRIAALFYKLYRTSEETGGKLRDYPLLMVWQISRTMPSLAPSSGFGGLSRAGPLLLLVLALGGALYVTRKRLARVREKDSPGRPRFSVQWRTGGRLGRQDGDSNRAGAGEVVDGPVDPALAKAARDFLSKHGEDEDGADHPH